MLEKIKYDDFSLKDKKFNHPFTFKEKELTDILNSLFFSERNSFSSWGEERQMFNIEESGKIANHIKKRLEAAKTDEMVVFEIETTNGRTGGEVFIDNGLNLRFNRINGIPFSIEREPMGFQPRGEYSYSSDNYKVIPHISHKYFSSKGIFGKESSQLNWVIIDTNKIETPAATPASASPKAKEATALSERLQILKDLKDKGLISETDYEKKKKEILDSL